MAKFDIKLYRYKLEYKKPILMKGQWQTHRMGILLEAKAKARASEGEGRRAKRKGLRAKSLGEESPTSNTETTTTTIFTEFAPFQGLHPETVDDIIKLKNPIIEAANNILNGKAADLSKFPNSVKIGLEFLSITTTTNTNTTTNSIINVAPLIHGSQSEIIDQINKINSIENIRSIKLKLGRQELIKDIELFNKIDELLNNKIIIRADVNRGWSFDKALKFASKINIERIEYLEEPINDPFKLDEFYEITGLNYALDESIYEGKNIDEFNCYHALIIKPNLLNSLSYLEIFKENNYKMIFSSAFESGILISKYFELINRYADLNDAQGLDTYSSFTEDLLDPRLAFCSYEINLKESDISNKNIKYELLEEL